MWDVISTLILLVMAVAVLMILGSLAWGLALYLLGDVTPADPFGYRAKRHADLTPDEEDTP